MTIQPTLKSEGFFLQHKCDYVAFTEIIIIFVAVMDKTDLILEVERLQDEIGILEMDLELSKSENSVLKGEREDLNERLKSFEECVKRLRDNERQFTETIVRQLLPTLRNKRKELASLKRDSLIVIVSLMLFIFYLLCK